MTPVPDTDDTPDAHASGAAAFVAEGLGPLAEAGPIGIAVAVALFPVAWAVSKLWRRRRA